MLITSYVGGMQHCLIHPLLWEAGTPILLNISDPGYHLKHTIESLKKEIAIKGEEINIKIIKLKYVNRDLEKQNEDLKQTVQEVKVVLGAKNNTMDQSCKKTFSSGILIFC